MVDGGWSRGPQDKNCQRKYGLMDDWKCLKIVSIFAEIIKS